MYVGKGKKDHMKLKPALEIELTAAASPRGAEHRSAFGRRREAQRLRQLTKFCLDLEEIELVRALKGGTEVAVSTHVGSFTEVKKSSLTGV